ncbi:MAG TPA: succinyl-diaminopimelate desuccinylase [Rhizomicrobium sp.]|nr:succinyl-diaminopimelate desuccinylase [Rhizomicrobium sp.]
MPIDAVALSQALIRCPSVTPQDAGALAVLEAALNSLGFACKRLRFEEAGTASVDNLYARIGSGAPHLCFAGHTDVVPAGDLAQWKHDPFGAEISDGVLYGRGAADMKSAIAAFAAAAERHLAKGALKGSISFLITGDEEGVSINGTKKMLGWLSGNNEPIDHCIVGEPTSAAASGDTLKIGRRGSINFRVVVRGVQGHVGYPQRALNPIPILAALIGRLSGEALDNGTAHFEPSALSFTSVDVGNDATNVIPAEASARFNIRFNDLHTPETLKHRIETAAKNVAHEMGGEISLSSQTSGVAFLTQPGPFTELVSKAVAKVTGQIPQFSTGGGTSDARFIKEHCPVVELGLSGSTMHKVDECVPVCEIHRLTDIYEAVLDAYFAPR